MHVHIEGGGVLCNILPAACLYLFPSQLLFFCIYLQFIPSFFSSGSNNTVHVGFCFEIFARARKKEAKCQILLTFHGLLLLINRRGRENNAQRVCFCRQDLEFGFLALLKLHQKWSRLVDMNTLTWAQRPEDLVPKVKWLSSIYGFSRGRVVRNRVAAGIFPMWKLISVLCCVQTAAHKQSQNRTQRTAQGPSEWNNSIHGQTVHFSSKCFLKKTTFLCWTHTVAVWQWRTIDCAGVLTPFQLLKKRPRWTISACQTALLKRIAVKV